MMISLSSWNRKRARLIKLILWSYSPWDKTEMLKKEKTDTLPLYKIYLLPHTLKKYRNLGIVNFIVLKLMLALEQFQLPNVIITAIWSETVSKIYSKNLKPPTKSRIIFHPNIIHIHPFLYQMIHVQ